MSLHIKISNIFHIYIYRFIFKMTSLKPYTLVEFITRGKRKKQRSVDIVPSKWIEFNKSRNRGTTKFLSVIENEEDGIFLHDIVKNLGDPPDSWTIYSVDILGDAGMHKN